MKLARTASAGLLLLSALWLTRCTGTAPELEAPEAEGGGQIRAPKPEVPRNEAREAYFGDLHIHSSWSLDAYAMQTRVGPEAAYRYARGEAIDHVSGPIRMKGPPLDFMALTEHGAYMGVSATIDDPDSRLPDIPFVRVLRGGTPAERSRLLAEFLDTLIPELVTDEVIQPTWNRIAELADRWNSPGEFTAFVGYEYTSAPGGQMLHRNVVFRGPSVPDRPFTSLDSLDPEDLWRWMDALRADGVDVLAIPHNANGSNGLMYDTVDRSGRRLDADYAELRVRNEPISEVFQIKGQSETHPLLSADDEWASFEDMPFAMGLPESEIRLEGSYARHALETGLVFEEEIGANPYRFGMIGSSDSHNASSPVEEDNYTGKFGSFDGTPRQRVLEPATFIVGDVEIQSKIGLQWGAAGLAGVWARSNTREDLFDAMSARETFATSGPRIRVRFFGGWDLREADAEGDLVSRGYAAGVAMGSALIDPPEGRDPVFLVSALRDPLEAPIERIQIVKAWREGGRTHERVFDVACADGSAPDPKTHRCSAPSLPPDPSDCSVAEDVGAAELRAAWRDPEYLRGAAAFYYARVLQVPTCRWSSWDAIRLGVDPPEGVPAAIQERAVTSPIWVDAGEG